MPRIVATWCVAVFCCVSAVPAEPVKLAEGGRPLCAIVLPPEADDNETLAAEELAHFLSRIIGAQVNVISRPPAAEVVPIRLGAAAEQDALATEVADNPEGFLLVARPTGIDLVGATSIGTLYATYELLERLGCRWFMPGEIGEVVPFSPTLSLNSFTVALSPDFKGRHMENVQPWARRNKLGGVRFFGTHSWHGWVPPGEYFEDHPEYFALVDGERRPGQLCTSNPQLLDLMAERIKASLRANPDSPGVGIGPNDGAGFCECEECRALDTGDWDPYSGEVSITDRFLVFANALAEQVGEEFPDAQLAYYIYHTYMRPPLGIKPHPNVIGSLAPIGLCRVHGLGNPNCPEREYWRFLLERWPQVMDQVYHRGYSYNLAGVQVPISLVSVWREEMPACREAGLVGFRVECQHSWISHMPTPYLMARLMWDADADVDALLEDYFTRFFGSAAEPMRQYWQILDESLYHADFHTGNSFDVPHWYPPDVMRRLAGHIRQAQRLAAAEPYRERVRLFARGFAYLNHFQALLAAEGRHDFAVAVQAHDAMQEIIEEFMAYDPPLFSRHTAPRFLPRFWRQVAYQGHERTSGGNELVVAFADEWDFFLDPDGIGEEQRLWAPHWQGGNWTTLKTFSQSWSNQGLRYYKGDAWYRQTVTIPCEWRGRRLHLWFGSVDESARVWVNGRLVGENLRNAWDPFEFDITRTVRWGRPNVIVVRATNRVVDELGTGGILRPVMIWAAAE